MDKNIYTNALLVTWEKTGYDIPRNNNIQALYDKLGNVTIQALFDPPYNGDQHEAIESVCRFLSSRVMPEFEVFQVGAAVETSTELDNNGKRNTEKVVFQTEIREK